MTFYEIYTATLMKLWGDTTPPTSAITYLQGTNGLIANVHRRLQQDYNFWFMKAYTTWDTVALAQTYGLPTEFKEIINLQFKVTTTDYFTDPLSILNLTEPYLTQWNMNNPATEYPQYYELFGNNITLYPAPSEIRTLHLVYWCFSARPTAIQWVQATSTADAITQYAGEVISYLAASEYSMIMKEYDQAQVYSQKVSELLVELKNEDYRRRQSPVAWVRFEEF